MSSQRDHAEMLLREALKAQSAEEYDAAIEFYSRSIKAYPTAEAHTYLGWTYSFLGRLDEAIQECRQAISLDPSFGNPYNDIGSYMMRQGKLKEAIPWFEKAKKAPRYEPRHYPYLNLARLYMSLGRFEEARREYSQAQFIHDSMPHSRAEEEEEAEDGSIH